MTSLLAVMFSMTCVQGQDQGTQGQGQGQGLAEKQGQGQGQGQGQEILKANTKDIQKPLPQQSTTMKNTVFNMRHVTNITLVAYRIMNIFHSMYSNLKL